MSTLTPKSIDRLVLGTVNASYRTELDAGQLARAILIADVDTKLPHLATFFGEVNDKLILAFAASHGISQAKLRIAYKAVKKITGETNKDLERDFANAMGRAA
jgi:methylaspartate ammonia-lyase